MNDDIVTRLLAAHGQPRCLPGICVTCDAAEDIVRLEAQVNRLWAQNRDLRNHVAGLNRQLRATKQSGESA